MVLFDQWKRKLVHNVHTHVQSWTLVQHEHHEALTFELIVPEIFNERVVFMHVLKLVTRALCTVQASGKCSFL